jgi:4-amino-4-deoxy-L-arabinose transferase-like glycosyltransferase
MKGSAMTEDKKDSWRVALTLGFVLVLYAVLPMLLSDSIPHDMSENLYWGRELQWGYYKHPFLFAWTSYGFYRLFGGWPESMYILTQLGMAAALFFIYRIGLLFLRDRKRALMSVLLFAATLIPSVGNQKFNANTVLIPLLPMAFYFFAKFASHPGFWNAVALGASAGLAMLGKYFAALPLLAMCAAYLWRKENLKNLKTAWPYVALAVFFAIVSGHLIWLVENDFITLSYAFEKAGATENALLGRIKYPLSYLATQVVTLLPAFLLARRLRKGKALKLKPDLDVRDYEKFLVGFVFVVPLAVPFALALAVNMRLGTYWASPLYYLLGVYVLQRNDLKLDIKGACGFVLAVNLIVAALGSISGIATGIYARRHPEKTIVAFLNAREVSDYITMEWRAKFGPDYPIKYIVADKMTDALAAYLPDNPHIYTGPVETPAIDYGAMLEYCYVKTALSAGGMECSPYSGVGDWDRVFYKTVGGHMIDIEFICKGGKK